jgi:hypothetical protein
MAEYLGRRWTKGELLSFIGDPAQVAYARSFEYEGGKAQGVKGVQVRTGGGLAFTLLPGRGMDIPEAYFSDKQLAFVSGTGITSPAYYEEGGLGWLRNFFVGLLTTCGITNSGAPSMDHGEAFGLHGRVSNAAAEDLCIQQRWEGDEYLITVRGRIRESKAMFENLMMTRTVETALGRKGFRLVDRIENNGFEPQPLMMLYHFNFGYPLLGPGAAIVGPVVKSEPRDEEAAKGRGVQECLQIPEPVEGYREKVFFHDLAAAGDGRTFIGLVNRNTPDGAPLGMVLRFSRNELPYLTEWKMVKKGFYVLGLEPGTALPLGRGVLRDKKKLQFLEGQQSYSITIDFEALATEAEMKAIEAEAARLLKK